MQTLKDTLKGLLLDAGVYYKIQRYRFRHDERDAVQREFYARLIGADDLVFDVGANVGQRADIFSRLARKVVAFEPQAECVRHLRSRFRHRRNVVVEHVALGAEEGEAVMYQCDSHTLSSLSPRFVSVMGREVFKEAHWDRKLRVRTTTLDQMIETHGLPKFIKIDVEGFELDVLRGLTRPAPLISFEFTPVLIDDAAACAARLHEISADYRFNYGLGEGLAFVRGEDADYETFTSEVLPEMARVDQFGDVYAILK